MLAPALLTGAFAVPALTALRRLTRGDDVGGGFAHLVMSVAMIAMAWGWSGGATIGQAVFGLLAAWSLARLVTAPTGVRRATEAAHLIMFAAMVWMVALMSAPPALAPGPMVGHGAHAGHGGGGPVGDVAVVTEVLVVLLGLVALAWAVRVPRPSSPSRAVATGSGTVALAVRAPAAGHRVGLRLDAAGHALACVGTAAMFLLMG